MARGGKREGAGRKAGVPNKANFERQARIAEGGVTPLDVLIEGMRFHYSIAEEAKRAKPVITDDVTSALKSAREFAREAAPYVHPKLANVEHSGKDGGPLKVVIQGVDAGLL